MTEFHAKNLQAKLTELSVDFYRHIESGDLKKTEKCWNELARILNTAISEARASRIECDAYEAKVLLYEPTKTDRPPAPIIKEHTYVKTSGPWICAAKEIRKTISHGYFDSGGAIIQEYFVPDAKTVCGKKVLYPINERYTSPSWARFHELCPDCVERLLDSKLIELPK